MALTLFPAAGTAGDAVQASQRRGMACLKVLALSALTLVPAAFATSVYHDASASAEGKQHIGSGIYFDMHDIESLLTREELDLVSRAKDNPVSVVQLFNSKLYGDYGNWGFYPVHSKRNAAEFMSGSSQQDRGVCRHKARVMAAILNHLGIEAHVESGTRLNEPYLWHVWVYVPKLDVVADPTAGNILDAKAYRSEYSIAVDGIPLPAGWY